MSFKLVIVSLILAGLLLAPAVSANHSSVDISRVRKYGPQVNNLIQVQTALGSTTPTWLGLQAGTIDFGEWPLTGTQIDEYNNIFVRADVDSDGQPDCRDTVTEATSHSKYNPGTDPDRGAICLNNRYDFGMFQIDINNAKPPGNNVHFRRAMAHLVDMNDFLTNICRGLCTDLQGMPLPYPALSDWRNAEAALSFPKFDPELAWAELQAGGIIDIDGDHILEMDLNGDGTVEPTEEPVIEHFGTVHVKRSGFARSLRDKYAYDNPSGDPFNISALFGAGFRYDYREFGPHGIEARAVFEPPCGQKKYTLYQGGWSTPITPDFLSILYHSHSKSLTNYNCISIPELDAALDQLAFAADAPIALRAAFRVQDLWARHVPTVPLWSDEFKLPYRAVWKDVVNQLGGSLLAMDGGGANGKFNWLTTSYDGFPRPWTARWNAIKPPESLNIIYSSDFWGGLALHQVYDSLIAINPNKPTVLGNEGLTPWLVNSWSLGTYNGMITGTNWDGRSITFTCPASATG